MKKKKLLSKIILVLILISMCFTWVSPQYYTIIDDSPVPLASVKTVSAEFYLNTTKIPTKTVTYLSCKSLGSGKIFQPDTKKTSDINDVSTLIVSAPDYHSSLNTTQNIEWKRIYYTLGKYRVIGEYVPTTLAKVVKVPQDSMICDTVSDLLTKDYSEGDIVTTLGYSSLNDEGCAKYIISTSPSSTFSHRLENGLWANLQLNNTSVVNVASLGIFPGSNISDSLNIAIEELSGKISHLQFNNGNYYIDKAIHLKTLSYKGTQNTNLIVDERYAQDTVKIFSTEESDRLTSIQFYGINFYFITSSGSIRNGKETVLLSLMSINDCEIDSCTFNAYPSDTDTGFTPVDLIWFQQTKNMGNINIKNCSFKNMTGQSYQGEYYDHLVGGCLWFSGPPKTTPLFKDINIVDCNFESTVSDELLCAWNGNFTNFKVSGCQFSTMDSHSSDNIIALYHGVFHNTVIEDSTVTVNSPCMHIIKPTAFTDASDITFKNCDINVNFSVTDTSKSYAVFRTASDYLTHSENSVISIDSCNVSSTAENAKYFTFIHADTLENKIYNIKNTKVDLSLDSGIFYTKASRNLGLNIADSELDTHGNFIICNNSLVDISLSSNLIKSNATTVTRGSCTLNCDYTNNIFTSANKYSLFVQSQSTAGESTVNLKQTGNTFISKTYNLFDPATANLHIATR